MNCQTLLLVFWHRKSLQQRNYRYILNVRFFLLIDSIVKCRLFYNYFIASSTGCSNTVYVGISVFPLKYEPAQVMNINLYITINHVAITLNLFRERPEQHCAIRGFRQDYFHIPVKNNFIINLIVFNSSSASINISSRILFIL